MNRETKRAMARQQRTTDQAARLQQLRKQQMARQQTARATRDGVAAGRRTRLRGMGTFGSEVVAELRKVNWPDRHTVVGYTMVVLISVSVITAVIFGLDTVFGKLVLAIFGS
ncbi:MAG TPA: preprotein translocase subunit SecE [Actinomycetes bacterium]|jgi:preprotein translocase SecE subunit|nr:preprotein translocase subunit SecE [Actinomycetes bacterium]